MDFGPPSGKQARKHYRREKAAAGAPSKRFRAEAVKRDADRPVARKRYPGQFLKVR